jgi:hypothetical protein
MRYYAKGIDVNGNDVDLTVYNDGYLYCVNKNLVSLESNATYVQCWNNCLTSLNAPNATLVYCWNNCLTELNLPAAEYVNCNNNCLTSLNLPNAEYVRCDNTGLKDILKLILDRTINMLELNMTIHIN